MLKYIKKVITACKELSEMETEEERKKEKDFFMNFFIGMFLFAVFGVTVYFLGKYVLIPLLSVVFIFFLYKWDKEPTAVEMQTNVLQEMNVVCELLCKVLSERANILEVIPPHNVSDIVPISYPVQQTEKGFIFYRFIILQNPDSSISLQDMKDALFLFIAQQLTNSVCPNLPRRYYRDMPYFVVFNVEQDYYHRGYVHIDIMPMWNDAYYCYVLNKKLVENTLEKENHMQDSPVDEDF